MSHPVFSVWLVIIVEKIFGNKLFLMRRLVRKEMRK